MTDSLREIDTALSQVQDEIDSCERSLAQAKQRQLKLQQDRVAAAERQAALAKKQQQQQQHSKSSPNPRKSPKSPAATPQQQQAYVEKIAELKRQIAQAEADKKAAQQKTPAAEAEEYEEVEEYEEYTEYEEEEEEEEVVEEDQTPSAAATTTTSPAAAVPDNPSAHDYSDVRQEQLDALKQKDKWNTTNWGAGGGNNSKTNGSEVQTYDHHVTPSHTHLNDQMRSLKQKHAWEKPAWASQAADNDTAVDTSPIANPLLHHNTSGAGQYTRQVAPKDRLARSAGTFVAPQKEAPPPRLCWIVVDLNQRKLGKIVLHLHGQGTDQVVDRFAELKGLPVERTGKNRPVVIEGLEGLHVKFHITQNQTTKGLESKPDIYGLVQEGKEVLGAIKAADEHAVVTIRQAHIYPVKKARAS